MKKRSALVLAALVAIAAPQAVEATPYASKIRVAATSLAPGAGTTISYILNRAATSVSIEIVNSSNTVVATFAGTTTAGANSVAWNGTADNATGAAVATGTGYRVRITANGPTEAGWNRYKANGATSSAPVLEGTDLALNWWPKSVAVNTDPDSDFFGSTFATFGYNIEVPPPAAVMHFNADLTTAAGDNGLASRILRHANDDEVAPTPGSYTAWGMHIDPANQERIYYTGQATSGTGNTGQKEYWYGEPTGGVYPQFATDADAANVVANGLFPRTITIQSVGANNYAFIGYGNNTIYVVQLAANGTFQTVVGNIINAAGMDLANRYSKNVRFDSAGNIYWVSQRVGSLTTTADGRIYKWSAAQLAAAIADPATNGLTSANAQAVIINNLATRQRTAAFAIDNAGNGFVLSAAHGVYAVGPVASLPATLNLSDTTLVIDKEFIRSTTQFTSDGTAEMTFDAAGNLIVVDGGGENIMAFAPPAASATTTTFTAPPSQTFAITASTADWEVMY